MAALDPYRTLGVSKGASDAEVKRAYRRLARQFHPDVTGDNPGTTERFKDITAAYELLSDPQRRRTYDLFGAADADKDMGFGFADLVSELFNKKSKSTDPIPGVDVERELKLTLREAFTGTEAVLDVDLLRTCATCAGLGYPAEFPPDPCAGCGGTGKTTSGLLPFPRTCASCDGTGFVRKHFCKSCSGEGLKRVSERLKVTVPAGVEPGTRLRLKQKGEAGRNGAIAGDLYAVVRIQDDPRFVREGPDLRTELKIGLKDAILGGKLDVPLPDGTATMAIPSGTQGGQVFRIKGRGFPRLASGVTGDLYVTVQVRIPRSVDEETRALLTTLAERLPEL